MNLYQCHSDLASYPGLLAPAFVACTNVGGRPGKTEARGMTYLDMWRSGTFPEKQQVSQCTTDCKHRPQNDWVLDIRQSWRHFLDSESHFTVVKKECATPPHIQVHHSHDSVLPGLPRVITASDKCWGEKAWVQGYYSAMIRAAACLYTVYNAEKDSTKWKTVAGQW